MGELREDVGLSGLTIRCSMLACAMFPRASSSPSRARASAAAICASTANGAPFMLEINPNCGVYYLPEDAGSADLCLAARSGRSCRLHAPADPCGVTATSTARRAPRPSHVDRFENVGDVITASVRVDRAGRLRTRTDFWVRLATIGISAYCMRRCRLGRPKLRLRQLLQRLLLKTPAGALRDFGVIRFPRSRRHINDIMDKEHVTAHK